MSGFKKTLVAAILIVAASASPLFGDILQLPKFFYGFASDVINIESSRSAFIHAYSYVKYLLQCLSFPVVAVVFVGVYGCKRLWSLLFSPLEYKCNLADTGYLEEGLSKRETANQVRKRRKIGEVPPVYPNGWFFVILSQELPVKGVKYMQLLGEHLAVFRGEDGVPYILDAYCPHLGANIAVGGQVEGSCIKCPFHGWCFDGDSGACVGIPYSKCVPEFARTKSWNTIERNKRVYMWYHAEGVEPDWFPEEIEDIKNGKWSYCGQTVHHINCHIEDLPENGGDINHLNILHTPLIPSGKNLNKMFNSFWDLCGYHEWIGSWTALDGDEKHCGVLSIVQKAHLFGYHLSFLDFHVQAKQIGPGIVYMRWNSIFGKGVMTHEVTPVEPLLQRLSQTNYTALPKLFAKTMLFAESVQLERDVMVWNYKTYLSKPLLVKEDIGIKKHRKWYSQFYSENSPRLTLAKNNMEW